MKKSTPKSPITLTAYAKQRGVSVEAVCKAVSTGRLSRSVTFVADKAKISDPELADREWRNRTRPKADNASPPAAATASPTPGAGDDDVWREARGRREAAAAALAEIELAQKRGSLVRAQDIEARLADVFTRSRNKVLGVVSRAREADPTLTAPQLELIDTLIREALEELAAGSKETT